MLRAEETELAEDNFREISEGKCGYAESRQSVAKKD